MSNNKKQQSKKQDEQISKPADAKPSKQTTLTMPALQAQARAPKMANGASRSSEKVKASPAKVSLPPKTTEAESWELPSPTKSPRNGINKHSPSKNTRG